MQAVEEKKQPKGETHRHQKNLVLLKFNKKHVLAQEVNYIEWRFKLDKSFGSKKHFLKLIRAVFLTFVIHTKTNENDKENPEKNE